MPEAAPFGALAFLVTWSLLTAPAVAQQPDTLIFEPVPREDSTVPRVFLDCRNCDQVYLLREIPFVDYVRDRQVADIHLLITEQRTGSGGSEFALSFIGRKGFLGVDQRLIYTSATGSTRDEERSGLAQRMKLGLIPYASQTRLADQLAVSYTAPEQSTRPTQEFDPWNSWVFEVSGDGSLNGEATRQSYLARGSASASRVTPLWKIRMFVFMEYTERRFERGDETIESSLKRQRIVGSIVYSLSEHWSAGVFSTANATTFENIDLELSLAPALEYSVFPYEQSARKELTFAYRAGIQSMNYIEETLFGQTAEFLASESITAALRVTQPWGNLFLQLEGSHFFHDFSKNRLEFSGSVSVRVFKGLSVRASGSLDIIHDQLYLPRGEGSLEDLLLQQKQLATTYQFRAAIGLSYTFGSIFSNVVNTRL